VTQPKLAGGGRAGQYLNLPYDIIVPQKYHDIIKYCDIIVRMQACYH